ncbi:hypothetical protein V9T40_007693 [Parthenolecanium corni]|uniref:Axin n=1 Tax=Parthenolecanium corni TaxID=536013 RepID=A0AAN9THJ3_9HEMI
MTSNTSDSNQASTFEPRGIRSKESGSDSNGSPDPASNCLKWADNLQELLNDPVGLNLFLKYLEKEDDDRFHMLKFWYACRGVSQQQDAKTIDQAIKIIYRNLFLKIKSGINDEVKSALAVKIKEAKSRRQDPNNPSGVLLNANIFNDACKIVEKQMNEIMYPNFLRSDTYLKYMQDQCNVDNNSREALAFPEDQEDELPVSFSPTLPVVDEDKELTLDEVSFERGRPSSKSFLGKLGMYSTSSRPPSNLHLYYSSYTQNSELQSVSSGARTDSILDLTVDDASTSKNTYTYQRHRQMQKQQGMESQPININRMDDVALPFMPLTSRPQAREMAKPRKPAEFAQELMNKLELLKKDRDSSDLMNRKLSSIESGRIDGGIGAEQEIAGDTFIDDDDQEILDKHVSRIWSDKTPRRSPSVGTPVRPKSPDSRRSWPFHPPDRLSSPNFAPSHYTSSSCGSVKHKSKELCSVFSFDSGNYTDPTEGRDHHHRHLSSRVRSVSEYGNPVSEHNYPPAGYQPRNNRSWTASRRTLTDSGVSDSENPGSTMHLYKEKNYPPKNTGFGPINEECSMSLSSNKHRTKLASGHSRNKSVSSDRNGSSSSSSKNVLPGHLFVQDPNIPPYPYHNIATDIQLEETARRLQIDQKLSKSTTSSYGSCPPTKACEPAYRSGHFPSSSKAESSQRSVMAPRCNYKSYPEESTRGKPVGEDASLFTHVVYHFSDEEMPYLLKIPGNPITLKLLKEYMPPNKSGRYRYFFVKQCEELNNLPIQEEIIDDNEILPLFRGKVNAQIKAIE